MLSTDDREKKKIETDNLRLRHKFFIIFNSAQLVEYVLSPLNELCNTDDDYDDVELRARIDLDHNLYLSQSNFPIMPQCLMIRPSSQSYGEVESY